MASEEQEIDIKTGGKVYVYNPRKAGMFLNGKQMCEFAGISEQAFHQSWLPQGCPSMPNPKKPSEKCYSSAQVMKWRFDKDFEALKKTMIGVVEVSQGEMTMLEAERRRKQAEALLAELKLVNERKLVANIDDLLNNFAIACESTAATILSWRTNIVGELTMRPEEEVEKIMAEEVTRLLTDLRNYNHTYEGKDNAVS